VRLTNAAGAVTVIELVLCPVFSAAGTLERVVSLWHDISERKENEQKLIAARLTAELSPGPRRRTPRPSIVRG